MVNNDRTSRPLLLISDRISDLFPVLQHASTYQVSVDSSCAYFGSTCHFYVYMC